MTETTRQQVLDTLDQGWGVYATKFQRKNETEKKAFLQQQGYARLADLLGHVAAWWEQALEAIPAVLADPNTPPVEYDVDAFNAQAVQRFSPLDEAAALRVYEDTRARMIALVKGLPESAFSSKRIAGRLHIEVIGHLEEHQID